MEENSHGWAVTGAWSTIYSILSLMFSFLHAYASIKPQNTNGLTYQNKIPLPLSDVRSAVPLNFFYDFCFLSAQKTNKPVT